jgi:hypothetical protein
MGNDCLYGKAKGLQRPKMITGRAQNFCQKVLLRSEMLAV